MTEVSPAELEEWAASDATANFRERVTEKMSQITQRLIAQAATPEALPESFRIDAGWADALAWVKRELERTD